MRTNPQRIQPGPGQESVWDYPRPLTDVAPGALRPMDGDFYGGWITSDLTGPYKGAAGTRHW